MKTWGRRSITPFLTLALDGQFHAPGPFSSRETVLGTHCIESWVEPKACPDAIGKRKISCPTKNETSTSQFSTHSLVTIMTEPSRLPTSWIMLRLFHDAVVHADGHKWWAGKDVKGDDHDLFESTLSACTGETGKPHFS
jgi:hypothetical protein